jgi:hypothetical protein
LEEVREEVVARFGVEEEVKVVAAAAAVVAFAEVADDRWYVLVSAGELLVP